MDRFKMQIEPTPYGSMFTANREGKNLMSVQFTTTVNVSIPLPSGGNVSIHVPNTQATQEQAAKAALEEALTELTKKK